jgi:hypothetical protein
MMLLLLLLLVSIHVNAWSRKVAHSSGYAGFCECDDLSAERRRRRKRRR